MNNKLHIVAVTAIIKNETGDRVLVLKRHDDEVAFPGKWAFPGGKVERGQSIMEALEREVEEEAGLKIKPGKNFIRDYTFIRPDDVNVVGFAFEVQSLGGEVKISEDFTDYKWVNLEELKKLDYIEGMEKEVAMVL